jgi:two-component system sensor histidine kinase KdpD
MNFTEHLPTLAEREEANWRRYVIDSILGIVGALSVTGIIYAFRLYPRIPNISLAYLLVVLALASTRRLYPAILASVVAFLSFDFFLVPPFYTFTIAKLEEWLALFVFLVTAIITGQLASALRERAEQASRREQETRILYDLVRATNREEDLQRQLSIIAHAIVDVFSSWGVRESALLLPDEKGKLTLQGSASILRPADQVKLSPDEEAVAARIMAQSQTGELQQVSPVTPAYHAFHTSTDSPSEGSVHHTATEHSLHQSRRIIPLRTGQKAVGVLFLLIEDDSRLFSNVARHTRGLVGRGEVEDTQNVARPLVGLVGRGQERLSPRTAFFRTFLDQAALLIERARLRRESWQVEVLRRTDALRAALLSSVSHDLRTPLASIKAAASSLLQEDVQWDEEARRSFAVAIERESDRLDRLVENLLDMSRIEGGALQPEKEWYPVDELIHDVLGHMQPLLQGRTIHVSLPAEPPVVELDYLQIDQVLTNLIENAARYTPATSPIEIRVEVNGEQILVSIADRGPGIPPEDLERIFDKFYRVQRSPGDSRGSGLGLAVSRGLIETHGGRIWAENRQGGGAIFRFTLPLGEAKDAFRAS